MDPEAPRHRTRTQDHGLDKALDNTLIQLAEGALDGGDPVRLELPVRNVNRTVGTMLGYELTRRWGSEGLPDDTIDITLTGTAGQSFAAFVPRGITLRLVGDANDYVGKGLSGGRITVRPHPQARFSAENNIIAGNVILYGATSGEVFLRGVVGERFCVRNSGALAVVEGVGDHGCEYMTGGRVVVLGPTGRNFAAGMSGGNAYLLDLAARRVNQEMVDLDPLDDEDRQFLAEALTRHHAETGSPVAHALLSDWDTAATRFAKVMPKDFKRVLAAQAAAERDTGTSTRRSWRPLMADPRAFSTPGVRTRYAGRSICGFGTGPRSTRTSAATTWRPRPAGAWTAASRSVTRAARWATSSRSGTPWCGGTTGLRPPSGCTRPTTSRSGWLRVWPFHVSTCCSTTICRAGSAHGVTAKGPGAEGLLHGGGRQDARRDDT